MSTDFDLLRRQTDRTPDARRNEWRASRAPQPTDDETQQFRPGSRWVRPDLNEIWTALSVATGAAVWKRGTGQAHDELAGLGDDDHPLYGIVYNTPNDPGTPPRDAAIWIDEDEDGGTGEPAAHAHDADEVWYDDVGNLYASPVLTVTRRPNEDGPTSAGVTWTNSGTQGMYAQVDDAVWAGADYIQMGLSMVVGLWFPAWAGLPTDHVVRCRWLFHVSAPASSNGYWVHLRRKAESDESARVFEYGQNPPQPGATAWMTVNPFTGVGWTVDDMVNTGIRFFSSHVLNTPRIEMVWMEVEYTSGITVQTALTDTQTDLNAVEATVAGHISSHPTGGGGGGTMETDRATRTSGSVTLNSTSWANVDTGLDLVVPAQAGDVLLVAVSALYGVESSVAYLDAATLVGGSPVNYISGGGGASDQGVLGWRGQYGAGGDTYPNAGTAIQYVVLSGDISGGNVTLRLRYRTGAASNKTLYAQAGLPFHWSVVNLRTPTVPTGDAGWTTATMQNSWVTYTTGSDVKYRKTADGTVFVRGEAKSGTVGAAMFTLPSGYRPAYRWTEIVKTGFTEDFAEITVNPDGTVQMDGGSNAYVPVNTSFWADA